MTFAAALILAWLSGHGYQNVQRDAAFVAARSENAPLDPAAKSPNGDVGLYQWRGHRKTELVRYERRRLPELLRERPWLNAAGARIEAQLEFMDREWRRMPASRAFFAATERHQAFQIFCANYTRPRTCR